MFPREDTGIEKLIRIDGYYYESSEKVYSPVVFTINGEVKRFFGRFSSKENLQNRLNKAYPSKGYYSVSSDTVKTKWAFQIYRGQYRIFEEFFLVIDDTTLKRIYLARTGEEIDSKSSDIYKFQSFDVSGLK